MKTIVNTISVATLNAVANMFKYNIINVVQVDKSDALFQIVGKTETVSYSEYLLQTVNLVANIEATYKVKTELVTHGEFVYIQFVAK